MTEGEGERRILARIENLGFEAPESDWINSRTGILGEHYAMACRSIQALLDDGSMVVVKTDPHPADSGKCA